GGLTNVGSHVKSTSIFGALPRCAAAQVSGHSAILFEAGSMWKASGTHSSAVIAWPYVLAGEPSPASYETATLDRSRSRPSGGAGMSKSQAIAAWLATSLAIVSNTTSKAVN